MAFFGWPRDTRMTPFCRINAGMQMLSGVSYEDFRGQLPLEECQWCLLGSGYCSVKLEIVVWYVVAGRGWERRRIAPHVTDALAPICHTGTHVGGSTGGSRMVSF